MRLYVKHIWRAFPELDRFSDEQCLRFTRAARRSRPLWLRLVHWLVQWAALAVFAAAGLVAMGLLARWTYHSEQSLTASYVWSTVGGAVALLLTVCGVLAWLLISHRFLRRRIEWVLRARGRCSACGYVLVGLPVDDGCHVVCPECGLEATVDASLGELSKGEDGRERYTPSEEVVRRSKPRDVRGFVVRWLKRGAVVVAVLLLAAGVWWLLNDRRLDRQAVRAQAQVPGGDVLNSMVRQLEGGGASPTRTGDEPTVVGAVNAMNTAMGLATTKAFPDGMPADVYVDGSYILAPGPHEPPFDEEVRRSEPPARRMLAAMEEEGVFKEMAALGRAEITGRVYAPVAAGEPMWQLQTLNCSHLRGMARWNGARMRLAWEGNDPVRFEDALSVTLGIAAVLERQPSVDERLSCLAIRALVDGEVRVVLARRPDARWVGAIERGLGPTPTSRYAIMPFLGERIVIDDVTRWMFSDASRARWGIANPAIRKPVVANRRPVSRVGTLEENLDATDGYFKSLFTRAKQQRFERDAAPPKVEGRGLLVDFSAISMEKMLESMDTESVRTVGLHTLVALERFRLDRGDYPAALSELTGKYLAAPPIDPMSGKPLLFKRIDPKADPNGRSFLLYSTGSDGVDNGGNGDGPWDVLFPGKGTGFDFIINNPQR